MIAPDFAGYKLGKLSPRCHPALKDFAEYVPEGLPAPPAKVNYYDAVPNWPLFGNDTLGDCTIAGLLHAHQAWASEVELTETVPTDEQAKQAYWRLTGGVDSGLVEANVLEIARTKGVVGQQILAYAPIHMQHLDAIKVCIDLFGGCYVGVQLPQSAETQFGNGNPWTVVDDSPIIGGHCVVHVGYDASYLYTVTWGRVQPIAWKWWQTYGDEAWVIIPKEFQLAGRGPVIDLGALQRDLNLVQAA